jgi:NADH dehydrogenase FAD-containing subunit
MIGLDRARKAVLLAPTYDEEGREITPRRAFRYDTLVIAIGSTTNGTVKLTLEGMEKCRSSSELRPYAVALVPVISAQITKARARAVRY